ncbi:MAG TPA: VOC family protein [Actinophytocola sp.]|uniref:VOC family protein n=1 Tax=Actinophytocola sp. TaxID=1872138 RepID=UPI002DB8DF3A|nr:VOC family protein [Actinophytocola sp.]HEU5474008.1 VOC family protein [Actinophytocola sp.]
MPVRLTSIVFEATDVAALAEFWCDQFEDWRIRPADGDEVRVVASEEDGATVDLTFAKAPPRAKTGKNRIHLDLNSWGMHDYQTRHDVLPLGGATPVDIGQGELVPWTVFADPGGNEFCLLKPRERYAGTGALAAVVVDSVDPPALAEFWSGATGWPVVESEADFAAVRAPGPPWRGPFLEFSRVPGRNPEPGPIVFGFESYWAHQHDADVARLLELGAQQVRKHDGDPAYTLLADPEGNELRVVVPVWPPGPAGPRRTPPGRD